MATVLLREVVTMTMMRLINRLRRPLRWAILALVALAILSYVTSRYHWSGHYPGGEYRIQIVDESGRPIAGVEMVTLNAWGNKIGNGYPVVDVAGNSERITDSNGIIIQRGPGPRFGGFAWKLFWLIPMGNHAAPRFSLQFRKAGLADRILSAEDFRGAAVLLPESTLPETGPDEYLLKWVVKIVMKAG